jgi:hypothetical protein
MNPVRLALCALTLAWLPGCPAQPDASDLGAADAGRADAGARAGAGRLESPQGEVRLVRAGTSTAVGAPVVLELLDAVETGADGSAKLVLADGRELELGPDGRFELSRDGAGLVLEVARGLVITRVRAPAFDAGLEHGLTLSISTPFGLTRVGSSEVKVQVEPTRASVEVLVGELEVISRSGEVKKVSAGAPLLLGAPRELPLIALNLVIASGRVELKGKDAKRFAPVNPKQLPALAEGDTVRVLEGRAVLAPDGSQTRLTLLKGAELSVAQARHGQGSEATALELKGGEVQVLAPDGQKTGFSIGGGVTLQSDAAAQYSVRRSGSGVEVLSRIGELHVAWAGHDDLTVPSGGQAWLTGAAAKVSEPTREVLQLPTRNGLKVFGAGPGRATLSWEATEGVTAWRVLVASDAAFSAVLLDGLVHQPFLNVAVPQRGPLFWRVYEGGEEKFRGNAVFAAEASALDLTRAKNVVPDGPDTTSIYFQDKPPMVTFTWVKTEGAAKASVKVYRDGELGLAVAERTVSESQVTLPEATLSEGKYLWSVTALRADGSELKGGRLNKLHLVYDNAVPGLVIQAPRNGEKVKWPARVAGIAPVGARVFVNGRALPLDDKARFDAEVLPLAGGRLVFHLLDGGAEVFTVRTVLK